MTFQEYKNYFKKRDGKYIKDVSPCVFCTEEKFKKCLETNTDCKKYYDYVENKYGNTSR